MTLDDLEIKIGKITVILLKKPKNLKEIVQQLSKNIFTEHDICLVKLNDR